MILIADSGASKTEWAYVSRSDGSGIRFISQGYNPNYITDSQIVADIHGCRPAGVVPELVDEIYFYGAGLTGLNSHLMEAALRAVFPNAATVFLAADTLGACRALLGDRPGFAAILGTGTNSCLYDGRGIGLKVASCGFILGDEGSGAYMGKRLITDFLRRNMPDGVYELTAAELGMDNDAIIDRIYRQPFPNRFCAGFAGFIRANLGTSPYFSGLARDSFRDFFDRIVTHYPDYRKHTFNCVGSVAYHFRDSLESVAGEYGMAVGKIVAAPMDGLVEYHLKKSE